MSAQATPTVIHDTLMRSREPGYDDSAGGYVGLQSEFETAAGDAVKTYFDVFYIDSHNTYDCLFKTFFTI